MIIETVFQYNEQFERLQAYKRVIGHVEAALAQSAGEQAAGKLTTADGKTISDDLSDAISNLEYAVKQIEQSLDEYQFEREVG